MEKLYEKLDVSFEILPEQEKFWKKHNSLDIIRRSQRG